MVVVDINVGGWLVVSFFVRDLVEVNIDATFET